MRWIVVAAVVMAMVSPSPGVAQEDVPDFVAEPAPGSQTAPTGGYFLLRAEPGSEVTEAVGLRNDSGRRLQLELAAVDATTGQRGGASYGVGTDAPTRTGAWIALDQETVVLEPGQSLTVPFTVAIPADAEDGQHLAGISVLVPKARDDTDDTEEGQAGASIDVQTRRVIAVQIDIPGPATPKLAVDGVNAVARPDGLYLEIAIENTGNTLVKAEGTLTVGDDFERDFSVDTFVPRTSIAYPIKWADEAGDGTYSATVELRYDGGETERWVGDFTVGQVLLDELADRQVAAPSANPEAPDDSEFPMVPLLIVAGAVMVVGAGFALRRILATRSPDGRH